MPNRRRRWGSEVGLAANKLWQRFRHSRLLHKMRQMGIVSLVVELRAALREPSSSSSKAVSRDFAKNNDPWNYETNPTEQQRFEDQTRLINIIRNGKMFRTGLEIGCAGGYYTVTLAELCESLLVLDISPVALDLARQRCNWSNRVQFGIFDLRMDAIPGKFDLIIVAGVLEYFNRPGTLVRVREKIVSALNPEGLLLVETTRRPQLENSWWGRRLIRGRWINQCISQHPSLCTISSLETESYAIGLYRRAV